MTKQELKEFRDNVHHLTLSGLSYRQVAKKLNCSTSAVGRAIKWLKKQDLSMSIYDNNGGCILSGSENASATAPTSIEKTFKQDTGCITTKSLNIKTLEDALRVSEVDLEIWEVDRYTINSWEVTVGAQKSESGCPETYTNYQVKVWLKRKEKAVEQMALEGLLDQIKQYAPKYSTIKYETISDPHLLELCLFDHHFGLLAWGEEVGEDYDLKIAERYYLDAIDDLLTKGTPYTIDRILIPFGNDFFHINDPKNVTPQHGNKLDTDSRMAKIFRAGKMAMIEAIDMCRSIAPVDILWIPGNHDPESSFYLAQVLDAMHTNDDMVNVDCSAKVRKNYIYGNCFMGFAHGCDEPVKELPRIFMDEYTQDWANTKYREIHIGHVHKKKQTNYVSVDSVGSTTVRVIPSLCGIDAWHYANGYVGKDKAAQSFLWHKKDGLTCSFLTRVK